MRRILLSTLAAFAVALFLTASDAFGAADEQVFALDLCTSYEVLKKNTAGTAWECSAPDPIKMVTVTGSVTATINAYHIVTAVATVTLPDECDSATGNWVGVLVKDVSETVSIAVASGDTMVVKGKGLSQDEELDSPGAALDSITLTCLATNLWYETAKSGTWVEETP